MQDSPRGMAVQEAAQSQFDATYLQLDKQAEESIELVMQLEKRLEGFLNPPEPTLAVDEPKNVKESPPAVVKRMHATSEKVNNVNKRLRSLLSHLVV